MTRIGEPRWVTSDTAYAGGRLICREDIEDHYGGNLYSVPYLGPWTTVTTTRRTQPSAAFLSRARARAR